MTKKKSTSPKTTLPPDVAKKILSADLAKIVKKAKDPTARLTVSERNLLSQMAAGENPIEDKEIAPSFVTSIAALCGVLGVDRKTYYRWKKKFGDKIPKNRTNGTYDVTAWREFMIKHNLADSALTTTTTEEEQEDLDTLKRKDLDVKVREREFKLSVLRGDYVHTEDVREEWTMQVKDAIKLLRDKLENELPPILSGLDAVRIRREMERVVDEYCAVMALAGDDRDTKSQSTEAKKDLEPSVDASR